MPGLCGYLHSMNHVADEDHECVAHRMARRLPGAGEIETLETDDYVAGFAGQRESSSLSIESNIACAIEGKPYWIDSELRSYSTQFGHAAALTKAYLAYGTSFVRFLSGAFAFAIVDIRSRQVFLAIDKMGIRQLCYSVSSKGDIVFGTTTAAVLEHPSISRKVSNDSIYRYLYFHVVPSPSTIYTDIFKLEPAELIVLESDCVQKQFHWSPTVLQQTVGISNKDMLCELRYRTEKAVARVATNNSVGGFLSGGIDSSTVCGLANENTPDSFDAYTIGFDQDGYDESSFANIAAEHFGLRHHLHYVTPSEVADAFGKIVSNFDEPFGNASAVPAYVCASKARLDGISTLLAGDGGDELFAGNERYSVQKLFQIYSRIPSTLRRFCLDPAVDYLPTEWSTLTRKVRRYVEQARIDMPDRLQTYNFFEMYNPDYAFHESFKKSIDVALPRIESRSWYDRSHEFEFLDRMLLFDWKLTLADNDLRKVSRMCEAAGMLVDYPLLDDDLVEFSLSLPTQLKMKRHDLRFAFKSAFRDYLPRQILRKKKHGFGLPIGEWLVTSRELRDCVLPHIDSFRERSILRNEFIDEIIDKHRREHSGFYGNLIWLVAILEAWLNKNIDQEM